MADFIQDWFNEQINTGFTGVNATVELAGLSKGLTKLKGSAGTVSFNEPFFTITTISGGKLVKNTFAAPAASGCGSFGLGGLTRASDLSP